MIALEKEEFMSSFLTYKGYPLVRHDNVIYYGNMSDDYVVMLQIQKTRKVKDLEVASKIKVYQISTDEKLNPMEAIIKTSERGSLFEALDLASAWLERSANK